MAKSEWNLWLQSHISANVFGMCAHWLPVYVCIISDINRSEIDPQKMCLQRKYRRFKLTKSVKRTVKRNPCSAWYSEFSTLNVECCLNLLVKFF